MPPARTITPAQLTRTSTRPVESIAVATAESQNAESDTSPVTIAAAPMSAPTARAPALSRSTITTPAPNRANAREVAAPIPEAPPVTTTVRPENSEIEEPDEPG